MRAAVPACIVPDWSRDWGFVVWSVITASVGVVCLAASLFGWLFTLTRAWQRVLLFIAALLLIKPGLITDSIGLVLLAAVTAAQLLARRRAATAVS